jgi:hypothetical protein
MQLITMAHLGEAQGVINHFQLSRITPQLFENDELSCLITGEGPFEAATLTAAQLARKTYEKVLNLGIAGTLDESVPIGTIHEVRSLYLVIEGKPQFKTFKSNSTGLDCLTSFERILQPKKAQILQGVATLVDREAWGVALAAKQASVPFTSAKLVSDVAGSLGACELVQSNAEEWAELLLQEAKKQLVRKELPSSAITLPGFHLTHSMNLRLEQSLKKLSLRKEISPEELLASLPLEQWRELKILPKERTRLLLEYLDEKLDPLKKILDQNLREWKHPYFSEQIDIHTDPTWESPTVKVQFQVSTPDELHHKLKVLEQLDLEKFHQLRLGEIHVE